MSGSNGFYGVGQSDGRFALTLRQSATLIGSYCWLERRLFQIYGGWVRNDPLVRARLFYDAQSQQHAWHSELFERLLPTSDAAGAGALDIPPSPELDSMLNLVAGGAESPSSGTLLRLVGVARVVLPRMLAGYTLHLRKTAWVTDAPLERALRLIVSDELEAWQQAELFLQELVRRPSDVAAVTAHQQVLEGAIAEAGPGLVGLSRI